MDLLQRYKKGKFRLCHLLLVATKEGFFYGKKRKHVKAMPKCISLHPFQDVFVAFSNSQWLQNVTYLLVDNRSLVHAANLCATMTKNCWLLPRRVLAPLPDGLSLFILRLRIFCSDLQQTPFLHAFHIYADRCKLARERKRNCCFEAVEVIHNKRCSA